MEKLSQWSRNIVNHFWIVVTHPKETKRSKGRLALIRFNNIKVFLEQMVWYSAPCG